jgi:hypothetical protein
VITLGGVPHEGSEHATQLVEGKLVAHSQPVFTSILEIASDEQMAALVSIGRTSIRAIIADFNFIVPVSQYSTFRKG